MPPTPKESARAFRWYRSFLRHTKPAKVPCVGYTNFSLLHIWNKFDCQTQFLLKETVIPLMKTSPEVLDIDHDRFGAVQFSVRPLASPNTS